MKIKENCDEEIKEIEWLKKEKIIHEEKEKVVCE